MPEPAPESAIARVQDQADRIPADDWAGHRLLAQAAAKDGLAAQVEQYFSNETGDPDLLTHRTRIYAPDDPAVVDQPAMHEDEGPMSDTTSTETFTPSNPTGYYGDQTPWQDAPDLDLSETEARALRGLEEAHRADPEAMPRERVLSVVRALRDGNTDALTEAARESAPSRDLYAETVDARSRLFAGMSGKTRSAAVDAQPTFQQRMRTQETPQADSGRGRGD